MFSNLSHDERKELIRSLQSIACSLKELVEGQKQTNDLLSKLLKPRLVLTLGKPENQ